MVTKEIIQSLVIFREERNILFPIILSLKKY